MVKPVLYLLVIGSFLGGCCRTCPPRSDTRAISIYGVSYTKATTSSKMTVASDAEFDAVTVEKPTPPTFFGDGITASARELIVAEALHGNNEIERLQPKLESSTITRAVPDPITVGVTYLALKSIIGDLNRLIQTTSGEIKALGEQLLSHANNVVADIDLVLKNRLDQTFDRLDETEKRMMEDASALVDRMENAAEAIRSGLEDTAKVALREADIVAYNATGSLACGDRVPRFVYTSPSALRVGLDRPEIVVRGNFLQYGFEELTVDGIAATVISFGDNEVTIRLPEALINSTTSEKTVVVRGHSWQCYASSIRPRLKKSSELKIPILLKPQKTFTVAGIIQPIIQTATNRSWNFKFYDIDDDCKANKRVDKTYWLPVGWTVESHNLDNVRQNCGSRIINTPTLSGVRGVTVAAKIKGCGRNWFGLSCKGCGWLGYRLTVRGKGYAERLGMPHEFMVGVNDATRTFSFPYPTERLPADNNGVRWTYNLAITIKGERSRTVQLSDTNPNGDGVESRIDAKTGKLAVELVSDRR